MLDPIFHSYLCLPCKFCSWLYLSFVAWIPCWAGHTCSPGAHAQNGVDEHKHHHFLEVARELMIVAALPPHFWVEVVPTSTYLINIQPSSALQGNISIEHHFGCSHDLVLRLFGCRCHAIVTCWLPHLICYLGQPHHARSLWLLRWFPLHPLIFTTLVIHLLWILLMCYLPRLPCLLLLADRKSVV